MLGFRHPGFYAGATINVCVRPQLPFRARRLVYTGPRDTFLIMDIRVGICSQFASGNPIPADAFPPLSDEFLLRLAPESWQQVREALDNCKLDVCMPGMDLWLSILNKTAATCDFEALHVRRRARRTTRGRLRDLRRQSRTTQRQMSRSRTSASARTHLHRMQRSDRRAWRRRGQPV